MEDMPAVMAEDWEVLTSLFPENWKELARETGALKGLRQDREAENCLRVLLLHVGCGFSLRETALRAGEAGLARLSGVAVFKRLRKSGPWLRRLCQGLLGRQAAKAPGPRYLRLIDATVIKEPGPTGSQWRLHYSFQWPRLECDSFQVTSNTGKETAESLRHHPLAAGDHVLADRGYCHASGLHFAAARQARVTVRLNPDGIRLETSRGTRLALADKLRKVRRAGEVAEWKVWVPLPGQAALPMRLCLARKSQTAIAQAERKLRRGSSKHGSQLQPQTLLYARYVMVLTTFDAAEYDATAVLEAYRFRWQIEVLFKRLKQIAELGHLPKHDDESAKAWLYGKLFVALLAGELLAAAESFSPWGYRLQTRARAQSLA
jgi:hypothetical protein